MTCTELQRLRSQASQINKELLRQRRTARANSGKGRGVQPRGHSDYEPMLRRKLQRLGLKIDRHVAQHQCQD